jgi:hypothetical protein
MTGPVFVKVQKTHYHFLLAELHLGFQFFMNLLTIYENVQKCFWLTARSALVQLYLRGWSG